MGITLPKDSDVIPDLSILERDLILDTKRLSTLSISCRGKYMVTMVTYGRHGYHGYIWETHGYCMVTYGRHVVTMLTLYQTNSQGNVKRGKSLGKFTHSSPVRLVFLREKF